jgi:hypothetical protein
VIFLKSKRKRKGRRITKQDLPRLHFNWSAPPPLPSSPSPLRTTRLRLASRPQPPWHPASTPTSARRPEVESSTPSLPSSYFLISVLFMFSGAREPNDPNVCYLVSLCSQICCTRTTTRTRSSPSPPARPMAS